MSCSVLPNHNSYHSFGPNININHHLNGGKQVFNKTPIPLVNMPNDPNLVAMNILQAINNAPLNNMIHSQPPINNVPMMNNINVPPPFSNVMNQGYHSNNVTNQPSMNVGLPPPFPPPKGHHMNKVMNNFNNLPPHQMDNMMNNNIPPMMPPQMNSMINNSNIPPMMNNSIMPPMINQGFPPPNIVNNNFNPNLMPPHIMNHNNIKQGNNVMNNMVNHNLPMNNMMNQNNVNITQFNMNGLGPNSNMPPMMNNSIMPPPQINNMINNVPQNILMNPNNVNFTMNGLGPNINNVPPPMNNIPPMMNNSIMPPPMLNQGFPPNIVNNNFNPNLMPPPQMNGPHNNTMHNQHFANEQLKALISNTNNGPLIGVNSPPQPQNFNNNIPLVNGPPPFPPHQNFNNNGINNPPLPNLNNFGVPLPINSGFQGNGVPNGPLNFDIPYSFNGVNNPPIQTLNNFGAPGSINPLKRKRKNNTKSNKKRKTQFKANLKKSPPFMFKKKGPHTHPKGSLKQYGTQKIDFTHLVIDTNCYLEHLNDIISLKNKNLFKIIVPYVVINELDGLKKSEEIHINSAARAAISRINHEMSLNEDWLIGQSLEDTFMKRHVFGKKTNDDMILDCALYFDRKVLLNEKKVILVTKDKGLSIKARLNKLRVNTMDELKEIINNNSNLENIKVEGN